MSNSRQSSSQKHRNFVAEPMGTKMVTSVPGIGEALGGRLSSKKGYNTASGVYGEYLTRNRGDRNDFEGWMKESVGANAKQASDSRRAFDDWSRNNL